MFLRFRRALYHTRGGWPLVDCDNASATCLSEWWAYAQEQPSIGIPALYFVSQMESTDEAPSAAQWAYLADLWRAYRHERGLDPEEDYVQ